MLALPGFPVFLDPPDMIRTQKTGTIWVRSAVFGFVCHGQEVIRARRILAANAAGADVDVVEELGALVDPCHEGVFHSDGCTASRT